MNFNHRCFTIVIAVFVAGWLMIAPTILQARESEVWISANGPENLTATGTTVDPFRCPDAASLNHVLETELKGTNLTIHFLPGVFKVSVNGIVLRTGWKFHGAGIDSTIFQLEPTDFSQAKSHELMVIGGCNTPGTYAPASNVEVSDLTVDCNLQNQTQPDNIMAVGVAGSYNRISRVKAINWGSMIRGHECFILSLQPTDARDQTNGVIEDCIVTQPAQVMFADGVTAISVFTDGKTHMHDAVARNNLVFNVTSGNQKGQPVYFNAYGAGGIVSNNRALNLLGNQTDGVYRDSWNGRDIAIENNVFDNVHNCVNFNMQRTSVNGLIIRGNTLRPSEGGTGIIYYTGELSNTNVNAYVTNMVIANNTIYPAAGVVNATALSLNGHISVSVIDNILQGGGTGCDLFINSPNDPVRSAYPHPLTFKTWTGNANLDGTQLVEKNGTFQPGESDTIRFTPARAGWYRIFSQSGYAAGTIRIRSEGWDNHITDDEFWFRVNSYGTNIASIGEIVESRRGGYAYPSPGNVTFARIGSGFPQSTDVYLDIYIPTVSAKVREMSITAIGPSRPRLTVPYVVNAAPRLIKTLNL